MGRPRNHLEGHQNRTSGIVRPIVRNSPSAGGRVRERLRTIRDESAFAMTRRGFKTAAATLALVAISAASHAAPTTETKSPSYSHFLQYGVSFVAENVASAGDICPANTRVPCILGSGFGATIRVGYRTRGSWYFGGAYEFSHHDSSNLLRLAILQQLRGESRYYFNQGARLTPYLAGGFGAVIYGNEWGAESGGPSASLGMGIEYQADESAVVGIGLSWRGLLFRKWTDSAGEARADRYLGFGLGHLIAIELILEVRDPLPRW